MGVGLGVGRGGVGVIQRLGGGKGLVMGWV